jgi:hypothetical protein
MRHEMTDVRETSNITYTLIDNDGVEEVVLLIQRVDLIVEVR